MSRRRGVGLLLAGLAVATLGIPLASSAAFAHDAMVAADPAAQSTVTELSQISLTFSADPLNADGADIVQLIGPDRLHYETDCPMLKGPLVTTPVALGAAGEYTVRWRVVSSDGHPISDSYTFTYAPADGAAGATGSSTPGCASAPTDPITPSGESTAAPSVDSGLWVGLGIGGIAVVILGVVLWLILRRPKE